uniref:Secreted protein n=1 Tax=Caenorhabditis tropicalis TaxID=1561998 RepID=A0A1I7UWY2_9PELO
MNFSLNILSILILVIILIEGHPVGFHTLKNPVTHPLRCPSNTTNCLETSYSGSPSILLPLSLIFYFCIV